MLHKMVDLLDSNFQKHDLQYEELTVNKEAALNSSH
jgi:hypothetical protein